MLSRDDDRMSHHRLLMEGLSVFLVVTLAVILAPAIVGIIYVDWLKTWPWTLTLLYLASALLAIPPVGLVIYGVWRGIRGSYALLSLALLLTLASPGLDATTRCTTDEEQTLVVS
jgi:hypothetical protein